MVRVLSKQAFLLTVAGLPDATEFRVQNATVQKGTNKSGFGHDEDPPGPDTCQCVITAIWPAEWPSSP